MDHRSLYHSDLPVFLEEAARAPAVRRLREVGMNCGCEYTSLPLFRALRPYSRYDHSLGAAMIVWHFTGDPAQALAGLLHDAATPAFAHVVDFLRGDHLRQDATEAGTEETIARSAELQAVLTGLGLTTADVCDYHRYPVADNDAPRLSADRLEYTIGNALNYGVLSAEEAGGLYADLEVGDGGDGAPELVFRTREKAERFAFAALRCARIYVSDGDRYAMQILSEILRDALRLGALLPEDLYRTEPEVIARLLACPETAARWTAFRALACVRRADPPDPAKRPRIILAKKRYIDPLAAGQGRVSALSPDFAAALEDFLRERQDVWVQEESE